MGTGFTIGWTAFRLLVWGMVLVWLQPRTLDRIGGHDLAIWLERHLWVRILAVPPLGVLAILSAFEPIDTARQRSRAGALAQAMGGTVTKPPRMDATHGLPDGPGLRVPIGPWTMTVGRWRSRARVTTIARVAVGGTPRFSFVARDAASEPPLVRGLQRWTMKRAVGALARDATDARAMAAAESLRFLTSPPVPIPHDALDRRMVLHSDQPGQAHALVTASAVAAAIQAVDAGSRRWSWSLLRTGPETAEMRFECPHALDDAESLQCVRDLMRAGLEHLAGQGVLAA